MGVLRFPTPISLLVFSVSTNRRNRNVRSHPLSVTFCLFFFLVWQYVSCPVGGRCLDRTMDETLYVKITSSRVGKQIYNRHRHKYDVTVSTYQNSLRHIRRSEFENDKPGKDSLKRLVTICHKVKHRLCYLILFRLFLLSHPSMMIS